MNKKQLKQDIVKQNDKTMHKVILNLAMSLDGYIADETGEYDWIVGNKNVSLDTPQIWDFEKFMQSIDVVVMGYHCYQQKMHKQFPNKKVIVATTKNLVNEANVSFSKDIVNDVKTMKQNGNVYLFGGGILVDAFLKAELIDEFIIGMIPVLLGKGRRLFIDHYPMSKLILKQYYVEDEITILHYEKK